MIYYFRELPLETDSSEMRERMAARQEKADARIVGAIFAAWHVLGLVVSLLEAK